MISRSSNSTCTNVNLSISGVRSIGRCSVAVGSDVFSFCLSGVLGFARLRGVMALGDLWGLVCTDGFAMNGLVGWVIGSDMLMSLGESISLSIEDDVVKSK